MLESITVITLLLSALIVWSMNRKVASSAFRLASRGMGRSKKKVALSNSLAYSRPPAGFSSSALLVTLYPSLVGISVRSIALS
jgi:hypothetical protein